MGGQGLILAGLILGEAATVHEGLHAVHTQAYAPLARGAASCSDVIISDEPVEFPRVEQADILVALDPQALQAHGDKVSPHGLVLVDEAIASVADLAGARVLSLPLAREAALVGAPRGGATVMALAVVARISGVVSDDALRKTLLLHVPADSREANLACLERGFALSEARCRPGRTIGESQRRTASGPETSAG